MRKIVLHDVNLELKRGDIVAQDDIEAVVNAANAQLNGGGGVDGALHRAAGPELKKASKPMGPIKPGEAVITTAFNLPNEYVIHCLGPVYGQDHPEEELLSNCYRNALQLAEENAIESIAFPAISCGFFGYPLEEAARMTLKTLKDEASGLSSLKNIRIVLWGEKALKVYEKEIDEI